MAVYLWRKEGCEKNADGQYVGTLDTVWSLPFNVDLVISFVVERSK